MDSWIRPGNIRWTLYRYFAHIQEMSNISMYIYYAYRESLALYVYLNIYVGNVELLSGWNCILHQQQEARGPAAADSVSYIITHT